MAVLKIVFRTIMTIFSVWGLLLTIVAVKEDWVAKVRTYDTIGESYEIKADLKKKK